MSASRSLGRAISKEIIKSTNRKMNKSRIQRQAKSRPESVKVETPFGKLWMSPIEAQLYDAMRHDGLSPIPQYCISGYFVDFAFPDVNIAVEADGAAYHTSEQDRQRDKKRDWVIRRAGWKIMHFKGSTIYQKSENCSFVIKCEVEQRRKRASMLARKKKLKRKKQKEALLRPFRRVADFFKR